MHSSPWLNRADLTRLDSKLPVANNTIATIEQPINEMDPYGAYQFSCFVRIPTMSKVGTMKPTVSISYGFDYAGKRQSLFVAEQTFAKASDKWVQIKGVADSPNFRSMAGYFVVEGVGHGPYDECAAGQGNECTHTSFELDVDACSISRAKTGIYSYE